VRITDDHAGLSHFLRRRRCGAAGYTRAMLTQPFRGLEPVFLTSDAMPVVEVFSRAVFAATNLIIRVSGTLPSPKPDRMA